MHAKAFRSALRESQNCANNIINIFPNILLANAGPATISHMPANRRIPILRIEDIVSKLEEDIVFGVFTQKKN